MSYNANDWIPLVETLKFPLEYKSTECKANKNGLVCKRGNMCRFRHTNDKLWICYKKNCKEEDECSSCDYRHVSDLYSLYVMFKFSFKIHEKWLSYIPNKITE